MTAPLIVSFWMRSLFTFVDLLFARTLGDAAVAAIGLSFPFEFLMIAVWVGLSTGLTSSLSQAMGAHQGERVEQALRVAWAAVLWTVPAFALIGAGCWVFAPKIAPNAIVARQFAIYATVLIGGSAFTTFWSVIPDSIVKAHNDTRSTMWAGIWSNVINVVLNTIFTFVLHWGIFGIGFSTVLGRFGGLAYALRKARMHENARKKRGEHTVPGLDLHPARSIFSLAVPAAVAYCLMATENGLINALLKMQDHATESIAAYAIFFRVFQFVVMPAVAAAVAMLPYAARRFGAGDFGGMVRGLREAHTAGILYALVTAPVLYLSAPALAAALANEPLTRELAAGGIRLVPLVCLASLPFFLCRPAFEGMGQGRPGLVLAVLRYVVLTAPCAWIGTHVAEGIGVPGLYGLILGLFCASALTSTIFLAWVRRALRMARIEATASSVVAAEPGS